MRAMLSAAFQASKELKIQANNQPGTKAWLTLAFDSLITFSFIILGLGVLIVGAKGSNGFNIGLYYIGFGIIWFVLRLILNAYRYHVSTKPTEIAQK